MISPTTRGSTAEKQGQSSKGPQAVSKIPSKRSASVAALVAVLTSSVVLPLTAIAQSSEGGFLMTLRLSERFISTDVTGPDDATTNGTTTQAITNVGLQVRSETRTEQLTFDLGGGYRFVDGPNGDGYEGEFTDPNLRLTYGQQAADSTIRVSAFASRTDLDDQTSLSQLQGAGGALDPDFADLTTEDGGTRDRLSFDARLTLRDNAPFGLSFTLNVEDYSYEGLPDDSALADFTYARVGTAARFDITQVMQANLGVHVSQTDNDTDDATTRYGIDAGLILTQPNGTITLDLSATDGDDGGQIHLSAGRSYTLEHTTASFALGASQATNDEVFLTGSASFEHQFAEASRFGSFTATADRQVTREGRGDEDLVTSLSVATNYALSPVANLSLSANYAQSEDIATGDSVDITGANLSVSYALNPDWTASGGIAVQSRDPSGEAATDSTTFSVGLSRQFDLRR